MKYLKLLSVGVVLFLVSSCASVKVSSDYDKQKDFNQYKTFAFYKKGIDKVDISDLDKRRILRAVEADLLAKGFTKSENPDLLVNIFTKSREKINVYNNRYYGWYPWYYGGFGPYGFGMGAYSNVTSSTEGTLFIDLIDAKKKELAWQGMGTGALVSSRDISKKETRIKEFVTEIMAEYPPVIE
ncbi:DUF4136 domain-containing protein [Aureibaculum marinum]|uniref:DUF4136 domain-containing protein n=1 Tax=Aureibaculum marinum TaxID=2487930 RepID=A0A3N4NZ33_9FLAO|nr:DUF4136 domain-containing protein [Aureibaculum marinum]RPE00088.1 DUF4136 domain-containing protein [Aureibaculum marinum]